MSDSELGRRALAALAAEEHENVREWVATILDVFLAPASLQASRQVVNEVTDVLNCRARELATAMVHGRDIGGVDTEQTPVWLQRWMAGEPFGVSTGICETTTYGYGVLDGNGYFEFPVPSAFVQRIEALGLLLTAQRWAGRRDRRRI